MNGSLYGTTWNGGVHHNGTVYRISTRGVQNVLYRFHGGADGSNPQSGLAAVNGTLYGTTYYGGGSPCGCGTVYSVSTSGKEEVLHAFTAGSDGAYPLAGLTDVNGKLYGATSQGGGSGCRSTSSLGCGTVFSVTTAGRETVVHRFDGADGDYPSLADLIDVKGVLYGTTVSGGKHDFGTVYSLTTNGKEKVLYAFQGGSDGWTPVGGLIEMNGTLYGTTAFGGQSSSGCQYGCGTVYGVSIAGAYKALYRFAGGSDGASPEAALIGVKGLLYGTTLDGGSGYTCEGGYACGTVFSITTGGVEMVLHRFGGDPDGSAPSAPLLNVNGTLYGTTQFGGCCSSYGRGTVFALTP